MNRRGFLALLAAGVAGQFVPDPEKLLWVPGAKKIFIPSTPDIYALLDARMRAAYKKMAQQLAEVIYAPDPLFGYLTSWDESSYDGGKLICTPITYSQAICIPKTS